MQDQHPASITPITQTRPGMLQQTDPGNGRSLLTSQQLVWCPTPSPKMTRELYIFFVYSLQKNMSQIWWNTTNPCLFHHEDQDLWVPNPSRVWSLWRWHHSTSVTLRRCNGATRRFMKWRCNGAIYSCLVWQSPKIIKAAPSTFNLSEMSPKLGAKKGRNLPKIQPDDSSNNNL